MSHFDPGRKRPSSSYPGLGRPTRVDHPLDAAARLAQNRRTGMERHPRRNAPLECTIELRALLAALRRFEQVDGNAELDVDRVRDIEGSVGCRLPDEILAIVAARIPSLEATHRVSLGNIPDLSARAREAGIRGDFVAFATDPGLRRLHGFVKGYGPEEVTTVDRETKHTTRSPLVDWLRERGPRLLEEDEAGSFKPCLVRLDPVEPGGRHARHARWGTGTILSEHGTGPERKVKIAFPGLGLRVVQARFLEFLGEE